jgi:hypothetical protein
LRRVLLIASTWSWDLVKTIIGMAPCSLTWQNPRKLGAKCNTLDFRFSGTGVNTGA